MELGGNAPLIVYDDADLEAALNVSVPTKFANAGQVCVTPDRFFVHESLHDAFVDGFASAGQGAEARRRARPVGADGPGDQRPPAREIEAIVADAVQVGRPRGRRRQRARAFNAGFFHRADRARRRDRRHEGLRRGELRADRGDHPVPRRGRGARAGERRPTWASAAYAFTRSPERARRTVAALKAGMVGINSFALAASEAPFGGTKYSGMGREGGSEGIADYLDTKLAQIVF